MRSTSLWVLAALPLLGVRSHHPTPTVVLVKETEVIRTSLSPATQFFVRKVAIGKDDLAQIRKEVDFSPTEPEYQFYLGKTAEGTLRGVVSFPQVNTPHGPLEVGLTLTPDGAIAGAVVTKATVETKPWVEAVVAAGLLKGFVGLHYGDDLSIALKGLSEDRVGKMPMWIAQLIATTVNQGLVLHHVLYRTQ